MQAHSNGGEEELLGNEVVLTRLDKAIGWARKFSFFPYPFATACCALEYMSLSMSPYDIDRFGALLPRFTPRQAEGQVSAKAASPALPKQITAFLAEHCFHCHGPDKKRADLQLHVFKDEASLLKDRKRWHLVTQMVFSGEMPPQERPRPKLEHVDAFLKSLNEVFDRHDRAAGRDPGRVTMRRLNRTEYNNTIRDLVGVDFQPAADFPSDDVGYGFDNIGDVLTISPLLMERYLAASEAIVSRAIVTGDPPKPGNRRLVAQFLEPRTGGGSLRRWDAQLRRCAISERQPRRRVDRSQEPARGSPGRA